MKINEVSPTKRGADDVTSDATEPHFWEGDSNPGGVPWGDHFRLHHQLALLSPPFCHSTWGHIGVCLVLGHAFLALVFVLPRIFNCLKKMCEKISFVFYPIAKVLELLNLLFVKWNPCSSETHWMSPPNVNRSPASFLHNCPTCPAGIPCHHTPGVVLLFLEPAQL